MMPMVSEAIWIFDSVLFGLNATFTAGIEHHDTQGHTR
jgi:hypothetical protein